MRGWGKLERNSVFYFRFLFVLFGGGCLISLQHTVVSQRLDVRGIGEWWRLVWFGFCLFLVWFVGLVFFLFVVAGWWGFLVVVLLVFVFGGLLFCPCNMQACLRDGMLVWEWENGGVLLCFVLVWFGFGLAWFLFGFFSRGMVLNGPATCQYISGTGL